MQKRVTPKYGFTPPASRSRKVINSSIGPASISGSYRESISQSATVQSARISRTKGASATAANSVRVSRYVSSGLHNSFDGKCCSGDGDRNRQGASQTSLRVPPATPGAHSGNNNKPTMSSAANSVKRIYGPGKVRHAVYCPSKAMKEQVFDSLHPFNAEQIMAATVGKSNNKHIAREIVEEAKKAPEVCEIARPVKNSKYLINVLKRPSAGQSIPASNLHTATSTGIELKCKCKRDPQLPCCVKAAGWLRCAHAGRHGFDYARHKALYEAVARSEPDKAGVSQDWVQIQRDLNRSFPNCPLFAENKAGQRQLERVLMTFTKYDPKIGYVQGMNFIVGALLYHCSEEIAFWLFVSLIEDHEMRDVYLPGIYMSAPW